MKQIFGSKAGKRDRLNQEVSLLAQGETSIETLAKECKVDRATIERDFVSLADAGVPIYEGKKGRVGLADWFRPKKEKK